MRLRIAARKSDLARLQAHLVGREIQKKFPHCEIQFQFKESLGDRNLEDPLWKMPEKGVFTEDFLADLKENRADMVVHSWKDLPYLENPDTEVAATLERADVRDLLLFKKSSKARLSKLAVFKILSSSPRRAHNLEPFLQVALPGGGHRVEFHPVRGNIPTRIEKLFKGEDWDGLVLAKAALDRLLSAAGEEFQSVKKRLRDLLPLADWMVLPLSANPAAPSQGALAVEILRSRRDLKEILRAINVDADMACVQMERKLAASYGGGCHQKIGITVIERPYGQILFQRGVTDSGENLDRRETMGRELPKCWCGKSSEFFEKKSVWAQIPPEVSALYVSHSAAWIDGAEQGERMVWTAGLSTWKALARRGVWVHGSSEGLGETEPLRLEILAPRQRWAKLGHTGAVETEDRPLIATYELLSKGEGAPLIPETAEAYYWRSASLYTWAVERQPHLRDRRHFCGPGHTHEILRRMGVPVEVYWPLQGESE